MSKLSHIDEQGSARMVDVGGKAVTQRVASAGARIYMEAETLRLIQEGGHKKGDVLTVARIAGIQAAKKCGDLIPLCHPLPLDSVDLELTPNAEASCVEITSHCKLSARTGVEMEALTAASVAALTVYDMCKAADQDMRISDVRLLEKRGGRSGHWRAP